MKGFNDAVLFLVHQGGLLVGKVAPEDEDDPFAQLAHFLNDGVGELLPAVSSV